MSSIPSRSRYTSKTRGKEGGLTALIPDFPFDYGGFLEAARQNKKRPLFSLPEEAKGKRVLVVGAGAAGAVAAYELLRMGLKPVLVEASDRYGGRMNAHHLGEGPQEVIAELGCMRFPVSGKAGKHYFEKVGMWDKSIDFPNPGGENTESTVVDYRGRQVYYEKNNKPAEYKELEDEMFSEDGFLNREPTWLYEMWDNMSGDIDSSKQSNIKRIWNDLLTTQRWDDFSFYETLTKISGWSSENINLFGQIGFGTGGWNTDYPNCILEVMRVLYTELDVEHRLMLDGTSTLPQKLITQTPQELEGDPSAVSESVENASLEFLQDYFPENIELTRKEVRYVFREVFSGRLVANIYDASSGQYANIWFDAIIYTPHVRILDKFRHYGTSQEYALATKLLSPELWEAIEYTHYMQSSKIFVATKEPFWHERDGVTTRHLMSVTLSDRLTRGTYLIDYGQENNPGVKGSGIFLSYTWNDDSLKFLGDRNEPDKPLTHVQMCITVLKDIYPNLRLEDYLMDEGKLGVEINWENEPFYLGAFKMNLPGQYEYQRRLFSQFTAMQEDGTPDPFVLAGDDISWVAGWVEGAITTAINAINKIAILFGGGDWDGVKGPIARWRDIGPIPLGERRSMANARRTPGTKHAEPSEAF